MSKIRFQRSQADQPDLTDLDRFQLPGALQPPQILDVITSRLICWLSSYVIVDYLKCKNSRKIYVWLKNSSRMLYMRSIGKSASLSHCSKRNISMKTSTGMPRCSRWIFIGAPTRTRAEYCDPKLIFNDPAGFCYTTLNPVSTTRIGCFTTNEKYFSKDQVTPNLHQTVQPRIGPVLYPDQDCCSDSLYICQIMRSVSDCFQDNQIFRSGQTKIMSQFSVFGCARSSQSQMAKCPAKYQY